MSFATLFRTRNTARRPASRKRPTAKPRLERLEERLALSGFGPEDGAYILESVAGGYNDVQILPGDQKIVVAGSQWVGRYDAQGNVDTSYGSGGQAAVTLNPTGGYVLGALALQLDGKAVVTGQAGNSLAVARLTANGLPDTSFGAGGLGRFDITLTASEAATSVAMQSNGDIVLGGQASLAVVASFKSNGMIDSGKGGFGTVLQGKATGYNLATFVQAAPYSDVIVQPDNKVLAIGSAKLSAADQNSLMVARYTAAGVLDSSFNGIGYSLLRPTGFAWTTGAGAVLQADGKIVVVGSSSGIAPGSDGRGDIFVARFNANGAVDTSFGGGTGYVRLDIDGTTTVTWEQGYDVAIQPDGKVVVAGTEVFTESPPGVVPVWNQVVARLNPNGSLDGTFGAGGFKVVAPPAGPENYSFLGQSMALAADGSIIVAGRLDNSSIHSNPFLMRFYGSTPSTLVAAGCATAIADAGGSLTLAAVEPLLTDAISRWEAEGADVSRLGSLDIRISDLPYATLGMAAATTIWLDANAAGWGWFVDATPEDDSEFAVSGDQGEQNRMDLLTVVMHELGHVLGHDHDPDGLMGEKLAAGLRQTDLEHDHVATVDQVFGQSDDDRPDAWLGIWLTEDLESAQPWAKRRK
ncbi:MAG: matrixin family metalloprotease [Pirellulaceae bacterium]|nr:matrixin family metalloprotease [Pirellulaceae bacterium]